MKPAKYQVTAVARACDILDALHRARQVLELREIAARTGLSKPTALRLLATLESKRLVERAGRHGYRSRIAVPQSQRFRIGYAAQSTVIPFTSEVTESVKVAAAAADLDLLVLNNRFSRKTALRNAAIFIAEKVDLVIEAQVVADLAQSLMARFQSAGMPVIAVDVPHPGATYFGGDSYRAGRLCGVELGRWAAQHWHSQVDQVVLADIPVAGPTVTARVDGILDGLARHLPHLSGVPVYRYDAGKGQYEPSLAIFRRHLLRNPAKRIVVGAGNAPSGLAALEAFRDLGREENCAVAVHDACAEVRAEMRRPGTRLVCSAAYFPEAYGNGLIRLALDILNHRPVPPAVFTRHQLVTPQNINRIYPNDRWMGLVG
jgi:ribose transport system substrate-binding protein